MWKLAKKGTFSVARFWVKSQVGENEALSLVEGLEKIFMKLSIEEKTETNQNHGNQSALKKSYYCNWLILIPL